MPRGEERGIGMNLVMQTFVSDLVPQRSKIGITSILTYLDMILKLKGLN